MSFVKFEHITSGYGKGNVIEDITFEIEKGELVGILGINGSGKSTLVKAICNVLPHEGKVTVNNITLEEQTVKDAARMISYIPQKSGVSLDIPVIDVVLMGFNPWLSILEKPGKEMEEKAEEVLKQVGLEDRIHENYMELSVGQKQLVIFARALAREGVLLLMDEPESALDFSVRYRAMEIVRSWIKKGERAGLLILHDISLALNCCDRLVLVNNRKVSDIIDLRRDTAESIEEKLQKIYGSLSLEKIRSKNGKERFVVLYDSEEI
ncbi:MAG: ABC transporter ATP-binding protein [Clostridia bacterium]|nr:ABC transporter ATP-binding protein [Clostridia bacterium]